MRTVLLGLALAMLSACIAGRPIAAPQSYTVQFGPITVPSGVERTQCIVKLLGNAEAVHIGTLHNQLGTASHHMIVYRVADTTEQLTPFDCTPFKDTLDASKGSPLMITQKTDELLELPPGVAYSLPANQMIRIEMHYINATPADVTLVSSTTMTTTSNYQNEADFLFIGDPDIRLQPGAQATLGPVYFPLPSVYSDAQFFAITGHEHQYGTGVTVAVASNANDAGQVVYDPPHWLWSEPATVFHSPAFSIPAGGGFRFSCQWNNTSSAQVQFGESANNEMCFFWAYYYPSHGSQVCIHTTQVGGHDVCCPDPKSFICAYINMMQ
jgi:hypothetical protein